MNCLSFLLALQTFFISNGKNPPSFKCPAPSAILTKSVQPWIDAHREKFNSLSEKFLGPLKAKTENFLKFDYSYLAKHHQCVNPWLSFAIEPNPDSKNIIRFRESKIDKIDCELIHANSHGRGILSFGKIQFTDIEQMLSIETEKGNHRSIVRVKMSVSELSSEGLMNLRETIELINNTLNSEKNNSSDDYDYSIPTDDRIYFEKDGTQYNILKVLYRELEEEVQVSMIIENHIPNRSFIKSYFEKQKVFWNIFVRRVKGLGKTGLEILKEPDFLTPVENKIEDQSKNSKSMLPSRVIFKVMQAAYGFLVLLLAIPAGFLDASAQLIMIRAMTMIGAKKPLSKQVFPPSENDGK